MIGLNTLVIILGILFIAFIISGIFFFYFRRKAKKQGFMDGTAVGNRRRKLSDNAKISLFYQKAYVQFLRVPIMRKQIERVKLQISAINPYDELTLRKETMRITIRTLATLLIGVVLFATFSKSLMGTIFAIIGAILINSILITVFVKRVEDRLLIQFTNYLEENRHEYQDSKSVEDAMYHAAQVSPHDIKLQVERIHRLLNTKDPRKALDSFYMVAPNRYLKIYAGVSHLVMEYGDRMLSKGSMYLNAVNKMVREIRDDITRRNRLSYKLTNLTFMALAPILLSFPIALWAETFFPVMKSFYDGKMGYVIRLILYTASIICYLLVRKVGELEDARYLAPVARKNWEKKLYSWPIVKFIVDRIAPGKRTTKHYQITRLLKDSNSPLTVEWFYIQRIVVSLSCFVVVIVLSLFLHWNASQHIKKDLTMDQQNLVGYLTPKEKEDAQNRTDFDNQIIESLKGVDAVSRENIQEKVNQISPTPMNSLQTTATVNRIIQKVSVLENEYFKWWELIIGLIFAGVGFFIPLWMLIFQKKLRFMEMQNEVDQFHTLISILSEFDRMSVETILEWMERYAIIFKPALQKALLNYDRGAEKAMMDLKEDAPFGSFIKVVNRLQRSVEKISLKEAFDDLEMQQEYHREQKIDRMNMLINKKAFWGNIFGWTPVVILVGLFLMFPLLYVSLSNMTDLIGRLQNLI